MSIFKIKIKTKNGNDIRKKETLSVYFKTKRRTNSLTKKVMYLYTYKIIYSKGVFDKKKVYRLTEEETPEEIMERKQYEIKENSAAFFKIFLNLFYLVDKLCEKENINPDFILFISPELRVTTRVYSFLFYYFDSKRVLTKIHGVNSVDLYVPESLFNSFCNYMEKYPNTSMKVINPDADKTRYAKSLAITQMLKERFDRQLQET